MRPPIVCRCHRVVAIAMLSVLVSTETAWAQAERAANNLAVTFTGPLARSLALVAIGLMFMFGEAGAKRHISGRDGAGACLERDHRGDRARVHRGALWRP